MILGILAVACLIVLIASPVGDAIFTILALIPGVAWGWIIGLLALAALVAILRNLAP